MTSTISLNHYAAQDPSQELQSNLFWSRAWEATLVISSVAFMALAVIAVGLTSTLWPTHLPVVSLIVFACGLPLSARAVVELWKKSDSYRRKADHYQQLQQRIGNISEDQLPRLLKSYKISSNADPKIQKHMISMVQLRESESDTELDNSRHSEEIILRLESAQQRVNKKDYEISKVNFNIPKEVKIFEALQQQQVARQTASSIAALKRIEAAYFLHLTQSPEDTRSSDDFIEIKNVPPLRRMIAQHSNDPSAQVIVITKGREFTIDNILSCSISKIASNLFGTRTSWF